MSVPDQAWFLDGIAQIDAPQARRIIEAMKAQLDKYPFNTIATGNTLAIGNHSGNGSCPRKTQYSETTNAAAPGGDNGRPPVPVKPRHSIPDL